MRRCSPAGSRYVDGTDAFCGGGGGSHRRLCGPEQPEATPRKDVRKSGRGHSLRARMLYIACD